MLIKEFISGHVVDKWLVSGNGGRYLNSHKKIIECILIVELYSWTHCNLIPDKWVLYPVFILELPWGPCVLMK